MPAANTIISEVNRVAVSRNRRPWYKHLSFQILIGMILGVILGYVAPQFAETLKPLGDLFIKLIRMLVAPIIFCTVVHGIASVGEAKRVGRLALLASQTLAIRHDCKIGRAH